ncbi:XF1762 family protein [Amycolatopsis sp. cg5]|uniref:XF1762 family protein n=1 Tax=Amycolatopsis sp. cg5 TaxID=3238802 RepID=UPI00352481FA
MQTCTLVGSRNTNSMLYGAAWRAARALGYRRLITRSQAGESGASLRAAGSLPAETLRSRLGWNGPAGNVTHKVSAVLPACGGRSPRSNGVAQGR